VHREEGGEIAAGRGDRHVPNSFALVWVGSTHSNGGYSHATIWSGNTTTDLGHCYRHKQLWGSGGMGAKSDAERPMPIARRTVPRCSEG
jgi:hypothetical protein